MKSKMNDAEAKKLVNRIFKKIKQAKSINDLKAIEDSEFRNKNRLNSETYPQISFSIKPTEIKKLMMIII